MKKAILALGLLSLTSGAFAMDAVDAVKSVLASGTHTGTTSNGSCNVVVEDISYPVKALRVTVSNNWGSLYKIVRTDSVFANHLWKREVIQSDREINSNDPSEFEEYSLRTFGYASANLYVVVSHLTQVGEERLECNLFN